MMALYKLIDELQPLEVSGTLIFLPLVNVYGYFAGSAAVPYDGKMVQDSFPGSPEGSVTEQIASFLFKECFEKANFVINLGEEEGNIATTPYAKVWGPPEIAKENTVVIQKALSFGTDLVVLEDPVEGHFAVELDQRKKIPALTVLAGGKSRSSVSRGVEDLSKLMKNMLVVNEMLKGDSELPKKQYIVEQIDSVASTVAGGLEVKFQLGDYV